MGSGPPALHRGTVGTRGMGVDSSVTGTEIGGHKGGKLPSWSRKGIMGCCQTCSETLKCLEAGSQDPAGAGKGISAGFQTPLHLVLKVVSAGHTSKAD